MNKNIYSLVLSDSVVAAVDVLAAEQGLSRSAMINQILAERVAYITPEMRLREVLESIRQSMGEAFYLAEQPSTSTLMCRSSLKYRYRPTVKYSVEIFMRNGNREGVMKVAFRTRNEQLIEDALKFFRLWAVLENRALTGNALQNICYSFDNGRFTRTFSIAQDRMTDSELGELVADYMSMFDNTMKAYFSYLPDEETAAVMAERVYRNNLTEQKHII